NGASRRHRQKENKEKLWEQTYTLSDRQDLTKIDLNEKLHNYLNDNESHNQNDITDILASSNSTKKVLVSTIDNERVNNIDHVKVQRISKFREEENAFVKAHHHQDSDEDISAIENQLTSRHSSVTVSSVNILPKSMVITKNNGSMKSPTFHHEERKLSSTSSTKVHVIKLPRNKVSSSSNSHIRNVSELSDCQTKNQIITDNDNNSAISGISNPISSTAKSQSYFITVDSVQNKQDRYVSCSNTDGDESGIRRRESNFSGISVSKIKRKNTNDKPVNNHRTSAVYSNNKIDISNEVTVVSVKKQQS
ncbi:unnamed protein product, partial [Rotaria sp. Silwood2]